MKLYLTRHGETEWNLVRRYQGRLDSPLTARGREQAREQAEWLADKGMEMVFTSPLGRAHATAQEIASRCVAPLQVVDDLAEFSYGRWEGFTPDEILARDRDAFEARERDKLHVPAPGGESYAEVCTRSRRALETVFAAEWTVAAITAHEVIGRTLVANLLGLPPARMLALRHPHGLIYQFDLTNAARPLARHWFLGGWMSGTHPPCPEGAPVS